MQPRLLLAFMVLGYGVVVVCLPSLCGALGLILSATKKSNESDGYRESSSQGTLLESPGFNSLPQGNHWVVRNVGSEGEVLLPVTAWGFTVW